MSRSFWARTSPGPAIRTGPQKARGRRKGTSQPARLFTGQLRCFLPKRPPQERAVLGSGGPEHTGEGVGGEPGLPKPARDSSPSPKKDAAGSPPPAQAILPGAFREPHPIDRLSPLPPPAPTPRVPPLLLAPRAERGSGEEIERPGQGHGGREGGGDCLPGEGSPAPAGSSSRSSGNQKERLHPAGRER